MAVVGFVLVAVAAVVGSMVLYTRAKALAEALALKLKAAEDALREAAEQRAQDRAEAQALKAELSAEKDAFKAHKKKAWANKNVAPVESAAPVGIQQELAQRDRQWREATDELTQVKSQLASAERSVQALSHELERAKSVVAVAKDDGESELKALKTALETEKKRVGAEAKAIIDMRRKVEWHRRIHIVDKGVLQTERDKASHLRQRFLELCTELVNLQKKPLSGARRNELERIKREEAAYATAESKQETETKQDAEGEAAQPVVAAEQPTVSPPTI